MQNHMPVWIGVVLRGPTWTLVCLRLGTVACPYQPLGMLTESKLKLREKEE